MERQTVTISYILTGWMHLYGGHTIIKIIISCYSLAVSALYESDPPQAWMIYCKVYNLIILKKIPHLKKKQQLNIILKDCFIHNLSVTNIVYQKPLLLFNIIYYIMS